MAGIDAKTGLPLSGWPHVVQSIGKILRTAPETRLMLRQFGSDVPGLQDMNPTPKVILRYYTAIFTALERWEPRFELTGVNVVQVDGGGKIGFEMSGHYYPRGHLGDRSLVEDASGTFAIA